MRSEPPTGHGHADAGGDALTEGPGRGFDARGQAIFRMAGTFTTQLAKFFDVVEGNGNFPESFILRIDGFDLREMQ